MRGLFRSRPCVRIADDDSVNQLVASRMLACWDIEPLLATDGAQALALACGQQRLDLILMDLQMPVLDGIEATRRLRRFELENLRARVPVVAYTATALGSGLMSLREGGLDAVLPKPCTLDELHACLLRWRVPGVGTQKVTPRLV